MSEGKLFAALRDRFPAAEYALFPDVGEGTGASSGRRADAIAMSLWPSRGLEVHGFEMKASRADALRELRDPAKAERIARWCDRWWLVVIDDKVVSVDELPPTWGLLVLKTTRLHQAKLAPKLPGPPWDNATRTFLAALLRAAQKVDPGREAMEAARKAGYAAGVKDEKALAERELRKVRDALEAEQVLRQRFEAAAGVHITRYDAGRIGAAVKFVLDGGVQSAEADLRRLQEQAHRIVAGIDRQLEQVARVPTKEGVA